MKNRPYYITAKDLAAAGREKIPSPLRSSRHLIYSSPATLAFNSPGAEGFGVKRAGLSVPGSIMLIVSPGCCGRNTSLVSRMPEYEHRFFYLNLDEKDVVTGRHLNKIPQAAREVVDSLERRPSAVMICITCVDALLGTDMERICRRVEDACSVPSVPCYMYALTREGTNPPMVHVRQSIYSLLKPSERKKTSANILGFFSPLERDCELFRLLSEAGMTNIREISTCETFDEFMKMSEANFNLLLNPEGRFAARDLSEKNGIPFIELARLYDIERNRRQYAALSKALGTELDVNEFADAAEEAAASFKNVCGDTNFGVGECINADPFELSAALTRAGFNVSEIYGTVTDENFVWVRLLSQISPDTKVFSNLDPSMIYYDGAFSDVGFALGKDARYYHPDIPGIDFNSDTQPFGFSGIRLLFESMKEAI